jgi:N-acetylmuramoyl-L-alanine amidase
VVIDPGHGGIDPGAVVASIAEKSVVLAFGRS